MTDGNGWTVDDHLGAGDERMVALYREVEASLRAMGSVTQSVSKTTITFKGPRRGFAGARPTSTGVIGYFDLMQTVGEDRCINRFAR